MNSGVTSSLSPNQNASTSLRPMPALATSRIFDSSRFWIASRMFGSLAAVSVETDHAAAMRHLRLRGGYGLDHAKAVTRAFDVELHARRALPVHNPHHQR